MTKENVYRIGSNDSCDNNKYITTKMLNTVYMQGNNSLTIF